MIRLAANLMRTYQRPAESNYVISSSPFRMIYVVLRILEKVDDEV